MTRGCSCLEFTLTRSSCEYNLVKSARRVLRRGSSIPIVDGATIFSTLLFLIPSDSDDIVKRYNILLGELKKYNPEMLDKSRLIAITKCDLLDEELMNEIEKDIKKSINIEFIFISSISNIGLSELKDKVWEMLN